MIVITGPGRSGTSLLAQVYDAAGFPPGGAWDDTIQAGLEDPDVVLLNLRICNALGVAPNGIRHLPSMNELGMNGRAQRLVRKLVPHAQRERLRARYRASRLGRTAGLEPLPWDRIPAVAARFGTEIRALAERTKVVKDPQFCWALPVWIAAGVAPAHVIVSLRDIDRMVESRATAGHTRIAHAAARNTMIYAAGVVLTTLADSALPHTVLRYPDYLRDLPAVASVLPLPDEGGRSRFVEAFLRIARRD